MSSAMAAVPERLAVTWQRGKTTYDILIAVGETVYMGRGVRCAVVLEDISVSSVHVELSVAPASSGSGCLALFALDKSRTGTGVLDRALETPGYIEPDKVRFLSKDRPEEIREGMALILPMRRKAKSHLFFADDQHVFVLKYPDRGSGQYGREPTRVPVPLAGPAVPVVVALDGAAGVEPSKGGAATAADQSLPDRYDPATKGGRWNYMNKLGEGGLANVWRARDCRENLGEVAIKVLKHPERANWGKQYAFSLHREAQWSLQRLHNKLDKRYVPELAVLFAQYLEDHTGFAQLAPTDFDSRRRKYEVQDFDWEKDGPLLPPQPYVVVELVRGECLNTLMDREKRLTRSKGPGEDLVLSASEKREVLAQAAQALHYALSFDLLHRDFRGVNLHLEDKLPCRPKLKVLDLGIMISADDGHQVNANEAVQAFKRRGDTVEQKRRYDWLPWEIRVAASGESPPVNFLRPIWSFDIFSFGILVLHLLLGRIEGRDALEKVRIGGSLPDTRKVGIDPALCQRMFSMETAQRPRPSEVVEGLTGQKLGASSSEGRQGGSLRRNRSRSPRRGGGLGGVADGGKVDDDSDDCVGFSGYSNSRLNQGAAAAVNDSSGQRRQQDPSSGWKVLAEIIRGSVVDEDGDDVRMMRDVASKLAVTDADEITESELPEELSTYWAFEIPASALLAGAGAPP